MVSAYIAQGHRVYKNTLKQAVTLSDSVSLCYRHVVVERRGAPWARSPKNVKKPQIDVIVIGMVIG